MSKSKRARAQLREWLRTGAPAAPPQAIAVPILVEEARRQGLSGLLHVAARSSPVPWPAPALKALAHAHREALVRGVRQLEMGARVMGLLAGHGLRCLPLKGAAVAEWLYESVADRPMADVDLLALDDPPAARRLLVGSGFQEAGSSDHAVAFRDPVWGGVLELHSSITSCPGLFPFDPEGLWARSRSVTGQIARIPAPEDVLLHLSMHASFQHGLVLSLVQWLDFRRLLERAVVSSGQLLELARRGRAETALSAALDAAESVVGAPVHAALGSTLAPSGGRREWLDRRLRTPLTLLSPAEPELAHARWQLLAGRRLELLGRTLRGGTSGASLGSPWRSLRRAASLVRRWAVPSLRAWRAAPE
jgi:hypothetical protein